MTIGNKIKSLRTSKGLTQQQLAEKIGVSDKAVSTWENNIKNPRMGVVEKLAAFFNVSKTELMGWEDDPESENLEKYGLRPVETKKFPMLGKIACGLPIYCDSDYETFIEASSDIKADFCLTAQGDSMINARIFDGDIVFIRKQPDVENGEIAAIIIGNEVTLKRVYKYPHFVELRAENPTYSPLHYEDYDLENIRILGKAVAFQSYIR